MELEYSYLHYFNAASSTRIFPTPTVCWIASLYSSENFDAYEENLK